VPSHIAHTHTHRNLLSASLRRNCNDVFFFNPTPYCLAPERLTRLTHNTPRYTISSFSLLCQQTANANSVDIAQGETPKSVTPKHDRAQLLLLTTPPGRAPCAPPGSTSHHHRNVKYSIPFKGRPSRQDLGKASPPTTFSSPPRSTRHVTP
jgi:hypothetical protein